jgi:hypothetical protein
LLSSPVSDQHSYGYHMYNQTHWQLFLRMILNWGIKGMELVYILPNLSQNEQSLKALTVCPTTIFLFLIYRQGEYLCQILERF